MGYRKEQNANRKDFPLAKEVRVIRSRFYFGQHGHVKGYYKWWIIIELWDSWDGNARKVQFSPDAIELFN